jgi:hypothetical protein
VVGSPFAAGPDGWVRIAHLSPQAPAMDMYVYPFGSPGRPLVLKDVSYGAFSAYMAVSTGARGDGDRCRRGQHQADRQHDYRPPHRPQIGSPHVCGRVGAAE